MEFYDTIKDLVWDDVTRSVYEKTDADVRRALSKEVLTIEDFKAVMIMVFITYCCVANYSTIRDLNSTWMNSQLWSRSWACVAFCHVST